MSHPIRVLVERGKKKRVVASAFDWPGWDRSAKTEDDALAVLAAHRPRYAPIANSAGHGDEYRRLAAAHDKANEWDGRLGKRHVVVVIESTLACAATASAWRRVVRR